MKTDTLLREEGMRVLAENLGLLEAERFIALIIREPFDYTKWQQNLYDDMSLEELCRKADSFWKETH
ncbi:MAG: hypothetical protein FWC40_05595 [Proteobacteria bacterium]|nr:hypothetical protein [Pseudomonadota bacterium]